MTQIPKKVRPTPTFHENVVCVSPEATTINQLIDYLHHRAELEEQRYKALTPRIDTIAGNQLEVKRGNHTDYDLRDVFKIPKDQPKRWRANIGRKDSMWSKHWYVANILSLLRDVRPIR